MDSGFLSQAARFLQEQKKYKRWLSVFLCLAFVVALGTVAALKLYGQAMTHKVKVLDCSYELHEHTEDCWEDGELVCGYADYVVHTHNDDCRDADGKLICPLEECEIHEHEDSCYEEEEVLVCGQEETEEKKGHIHTDDCYASDQGDLICKKEEHEHSDKCEEETLVCKESEHVHTDGCYEETLICEEDGEDHKHDSGCYEEELSCGEKEHEHTDACYEQKQVCGLEAHKHTDACYEESRELICTKEEAEDASGHRHTSQCYKKEKTLVCGKLELHTHDDGCYDEDSFDEDGILKEGSVPVCGIPQLKEHVHNELCFKTVELTKEEVEGLNAGASLHVHGDDCYDEEGNVICGHDVTHLHSLSCYDEEGHLICGGGKGHEHDADCYDEEGNVVCGYKDAKDHEHDAGCYDGEELICGYEGVRDHEHDAGCYDEERKLICGYEGVRDHEHDAACYDADGILICGYEGAEDHVHGEACYDEEQKLICGYRVQEVYDCSKQFAGENYIVTAKYNEEAKIPEKAVLLAEQITPENDGEHYADREAQYRELMEDENASMRALLKIGFYVEDEEKKEKTEIEPAAPVTLTIQFLDEDGLAEGNPITVIHFAEDGVEKLDGGKAENDSTTFQMESFSEIAIGYGPEEPREIETAEDGTRRLHLSDSFEYVNDALRLLFHVEGDAVLPGTGSVSSGSAPGEERTLSSNEARSADGSGLSAESETSPSGRTDAKDKTAASVQAPAKDGTESAGQTPAKEGNESSGQTPVKDGNEPTGQTPAEDGNESTGQTPAEDGNEASGQTPARGGTESDGRTSAEDGAAAPETEGADSQPEQDLPQLRFTVEPVEPSSEKYREFASRIGDSDAMEELLRMQVFSYSLSYGEEVLDLSECRITVEMAMTETLEEYARESITTAVDFLRANDGALMLLEEGAASSAGYGPKKDETAAPGKNPKENGTDSAGYDPKEDGTDSAGHDPEKDEADFAQPDMKKDEAADAAAEASSDAAKDAEESADKKEEVPQKSAAGQEKQPEASENGQKPEEDGEERVFFTDLQEEEPEDTQTAPRNETAIKLAVFTKDMTEVAKVEVGEDVDGQTEAEFELPAAEAGAKSETFAVSTTSSVNPKFKVQYYANLNTHLKKDDPLASGANALPVIDTSGKKLPQMSGGREIPPNDNPIRNLYLDANGNVLTRKVPTEVYDARSYEYFKAPSIKYVDALIDNNGYTLNEIWVLKEGADEKSTDRDDWTIYPYSENLHFTNREVSVEGPAQYLWLEDGAVLRFVYEAEPVETAAASAAFYDYDISNGYIYSDAANAKTGGVGTGTSKQGDGIWYAHTEKSGINSADNYSGTGTKLAFGNTNTGTGLGAETWNGQSLNKANLLSYKICTFGLVKGLDENGRIIYADGVDAPKLFNEETDPKNPVIGKTTYDDYSLQFNRVGDTYTLSSVTGTNVAGLESFHHPQSGNRAPYTDIWTNDFWPMDSAPSFGADGHDLKFGAYDKVQNRSFGPGQYDKFPEADDGKDHNSFFGMHYQVQFELDADYVGPLEYYFFGDDDMWVFLDGELVCDIGGVHSAVGEYVNLWDYLEGEHEELKAAQESRPNETVKKTHTLSFFYTERGASGSTCWMQFTLPSVSNIEPEVKNTDYGHLKISKKVQAINGENGEVKDYDTGDTFRFRLTLTSQDGSQQPDDYAYTIYEERPGDGAEEGEGGVQEGDSGLVEWEIDKGDGKITNGATFELKAGQYIWVKYIPPGTTYTVTEESGVVLADGTVGEGEFTYETEIDGTPSPDRTASGAISSGATNEVNYVNKFHIYTLPKTGGPGWFLYTIAGAGCILLSGTGLMYRKKFRGRRVRGSLESE